MKYLNKTFSSPATNQKYRDNYDKVFSKETSNDEKENRDDKDKK